MVKIRLKRQGQTHRPFYRIIVAKAEGGRNGAAIETLGTYNPIAKPAEIKLDEARALHWLNVGAQPTETVIYLLKKTGVLDQYIGDNEARKKRFKSLDKAIPVMPEAAAAAAESAPEGAAE